MNCPCRVLAGSEGSLWLFFFPVPSSACAKSGRVFFNRSAPKLYIGWFGKWPRYIPQNSCKVSKIQKSSPNNVCSFPLSERHSTMLRNGKVGWFIPASIRTNLSLIGATKPTASNSWKSRGECPVWSSRLIAFRSDWDSTSAFRADNSEQNAEASRQASASDTFFSLWLRSQKNSNNSKFQTCFPPKVGSFEKHRALIKSKAAVFFHQDTPLDTALANAMPAGPTVLRRLVDGPAWDPWGWEGIFKPSKSNMQTSPFACVFYQTD